MTEPAELTDQELDLAVAVEVFGARIIRGDRAFTARRGEFLLFELALPGADTTLWRRLDDGTRELWTVLDGNGMLRLREQMRELGFGSQVHYRQDGSSCVYFYDDRTTSAPAAHVSSDPHAFAYAALMAARARKAQL